MPRESSNDALIRRTRELRALRIKNFSEYAAERILKLLSEKKRPTVADIAVIIQDEFSKMPG